MNEERKAGLVAVCTMLTAIGVIFGSLYIVADGLRRENIREYSLEYISSIGENSVWFTPVTDHGDWLCGNYSLAEGVKLPDEITRQGSGWVRVDVSWSVVTKVYGK